MRPKKTPSPARKNSFGVMDTSTAAARDKAEKRRNLALEREVQRAWMYSAIVPGWGQARNQQHSRVLGIYLVFGVLAGGGYYYNEEYRSAKHEYIQKEGYDYSLKSYVDYCRRYRDLFMIAGAIWYLANVMDAYVGASLKTFDVSNDIGLKVKPVIVPTACNTPAIGIGVSLSLRKCIENEYSPDRIW